MASLIRFAISSILGSAVFALLLFSAAGTLDYWQGWVLLAVFTAVSVVPTAYLSRIDPAAIERRRQAGPRAESRPIQKVAVTGILLCFAGLLVVGGLDRRFGWSSVPTPLVVLGDVLLAFGLGGAILVVFQNRYAAANVTVEAGQPLVDTGLYGIVRHPMYTASVPMMVGMALALGSYWALLVAILAIVLLVVRILDEEKLLTQELAGYRDYTTRVRYRLVPQVW